MSASIGRIGRREREPVPAMDEPTPASAREMAAILARHRFKLVLAFLAPLGLALGLAVLLPKSYRAQTDIVVKTGREYMAQGNSESATLTAPTSTKQENINSEIALLTSRAVIERTIEAIGLAALYPDIVADPPTSGTPMDAAILRFTRKLSVEPVKLSNVIALWFDAASPEQARQVLDALVRSYIAKHTEVFASRRTEGYHDSIELAINNIRDLEQHRSALKLLTGIFDADTQRKILIQQRLDAESRLEDAQGRQARLQARLAFLAEARAQAPATTLAAVTEQSDSRTHATDALIDLHQQEAALAARLGDANPDLLRLRQQIEAAGRTATAARRERNTTTAASPMRQQIDQDAMLAGADLSMVAPEIEHLQAIVAARGAELAEMERADLDLRNLGVQIDVASQNLRAMQGRFEQARANEQTDLARQVSVVQVAAADGSEKPVGPRLLVFGAAGLLGGTLLSGLVALLAILLNNTAVTSEAAERRVGVPVLAVVPLRGGEDEAFFAP